MKTYPHSNPAWPFSWCFGAGAGPVLCSSWVCASVNSLLRGLVAELPYRRSLVVAPFQATAAVYTVHCKEGVRS